MSSKPLLTEPNVKTFLGSALRECQKFKMVYNNTIMNLALLGCFIFILIVILVCKYRGKLTEREKQIREREKQEYILSKIKNYQTARAYSHNHLITELPNFETY